MVPTPTPDSAEPSTARLYRAALGPSRVEHYLSAFARFDERGRGSTSWNSSAAAFNLVWLIDRALWGAAGIFTGLLAGAALIGAALWDLGEGLPLGVKAGVSLALLLVLLMLPGLFGTALLHARIRKSMLAVVQAAPTVDAACEALMAMRLGQRRRGVWAMAGLSLALVALVAVQWTGRALPALPAPLPAETAAQHMAANPTVAVQPPEPALEPDLEPEPKPEPGSAMKRELEDEAGSTATAGPGGGSALERPAPMGPQTIERAVASPVPSFPERAAKAGDALHTTQSPNDAAIAEKPIPQVASAPREKRSYVPPPPIGPVASVEAVAPAPLPTQKSEAAVPMPVPAVAGRPTDDVAPAKSLLPKVSNEASVAVTAAPLAVSVPKVVRNEVPPPSIGPVTRLGAETPAQRGIPKIELPASKPLPSAVEKPPGTGLSSQPVAKNAEKAAPLVEKPSEQGAPAKPLQAARSSDQSGKAPAASGPAKAEQANPAPELLSPKPGREAPIAEKRRLLGSGFGVAVGMFAVSGNADRVVAKLIEAGLPVVTDPVESARGRLTRVRVGPFDDRAQAEAAAVRIRALKLEARVYAP